MVPSLPFNSNTMKGFKLPIIIIFLVLLIDQTIKIYIKTHFVLGQETHIANWFIIHFTENPGMAFGLQFSGDWGKLILSLFRIAAIGLISWYLVRLVKTEAHPGLIACIAFIVAGATGNILDSAFYGMFFNESTFWEVAKFNPVGGGYATFLHGKVVDMLYFPILEGHFPQWVPFWGGEDYLFFRPVFNIADSSITSGVIAILLFQHKFFPSKSKTEENKAETTADEVVDAENVEEKNENNEQN